MINTRAISTLAIALWLAGLMSAAADPPPEHHMSDAVKARMLEEAKKKQPAAAAPAKKDAAPSPVIAAPGDPAEQTKEPSSPPSAAKTAKETPTVLPQVEVRKSRITDLDQKLAKQEQDIAREKKNTKPTEVDKALNNPKIAKPLAIFGGESAQHRQQVASERVQLMEEEKDVIEAIAQAKTKAEKDELQKQLDQLRAYRRELEKALR